jgi:hypothetical protein
MTWGTTSSVVRSSPDPSGLRTDSESSRDETSSRLLQAALSWLLSPQVWAYRLPPFAKLVANELGQV